MINKEISKLQNAMEEGIEKRIEYANTVFSEDFISEMQLKEYESLLNISGQNQMIPLAEFHDRNSDVTSKIIDIW